MQWLQFKPPEKSRQKSGFYIPTNTINTIYNKYKKALLAL